MTQYALRPFPPEAFMPAAVLSTATICYAIHHYLSIPVFRKLLALRFTDSEANEIAAVMMQRACGTFLLGIVPISVAMLLLPLSLADYGINHDNPGVSLMLGLVGAASLLVPAFFFMHRSQGLLTYYPEIRVGRWKAKLAAMNSLSWLIYLVAYELLFRGVLLFTLARAFGPWQAIFVVAMFYTTVHLAKHPIECATVAPGGVMLCAGVLYTGSLLSAIVAHSLIAAGCELIAVREHARPGTLPSLGPNDRL